MLLHRPYHEAGIELDVIEGEEEARPVRKAVSQAMNGQPPVPYTHLTLPTNREV